MEIKKSDRHTLKLDSIAMRSESFRAAASSKSALKEEEKQKQSNPHSEELTSIAGQNKEQSSSIKLENEEERNVARVDYIVQAPHGGQQELGEINT
jgi:type IV secretory pathway component VirB8